MDKPQVRSGRVESVKVAKIAPEDFNKKLRDMRARDNELVTGIFKNLEAPATGGSLGALIFSFKKYKGDENVIYELHDGERYALPRMVWSHLATGCFYKEYQHLKGEHGMDGLRGAASDGRLKTQTMQAARKVHRFAFHSLEFMDDDFDLRPSNLVEVSVSP